MSGANSAYTWHNKKIINIITILIMYHKICNVAKTIRVQYVCDHQDSCVYNNVHVRCRFHFLNIIHITHVRTTNTSLTRYKSPINYKSDTIYILQCMSITIRLQPALIIILIRVQWMGYFDIL